VTRKGTLKNLYSAHFPDFKSVDEPMDGHTKDICTYTHVKQWMEPAQKDEWSVQFKTAGTDHTAPAAIWNTAAFNSTFVLDV